MKNIVFFIPCLQSIIYICHMMRKIFYIILFYSLVSVCSHAERRYALIVAISEYPKESGWSKLNSDNDLDLLVPEFNRLGFSIIVLKNEQATKQNIISSFMILQEQIQKGDNVCVHFSCHGQQMEDDNNDEDDGLDEALIPFDSFISYRKGFYEGEHHLRDDEIETYLTHIRKKIGNKGSLLVTIDACHSGTAGRDEEYVEDDYASIRGTSSIFSSNPLFLSPNSSKYKKIEKQRILHRQQDMASFCLFSACQPFQRNFEIKVNSRYYGMLSYAFYKALKECNIWSEELYPNIWEKARKLSVKQIPMVESTNSF